MVVILAEADYRSWRLARRQAVAAARKVSITQNFSFGWGAGCKGRQSPLSLNNSSRLCACLK
jgi:hypothetical protein